MAQSEYPLQEQTKAEMNKRWSFFMMDLKKLATPWRSNDTEDSSNDSAEHEKQPDIGPDSPTRIDKSDRRTFGKVISFGRAKTFKRQQSELRGRLEPAPPCRDERRAVSADRRTDTPRRRVPEPKSRGPRASAPAFNSDAYPGESIPSSPVIPTSLPTSPIPETRQVGSPEAALPLEQPLPSFAVTDTESEDPLAEESLLATKPREYEAPESRPNSQPDVPEDREQGAEECVEEQHQNKEEGSSPRPPHGTTDGHLALPDGNLPMPLSHDKHPDDTMSTYAQSTTESQYEALLHDELEKKWILNLSLHYRDKSKREKFFVTYQQKPATNTWRRVTISLDYRDAEENSLESDLMTTKYQRDKSAKIYDAIRESLPDIQFYSTVTNLKLQTTKGRLHVHVVEDGTEIIHYPNQSMVTHLGCKLVPESEIEFDSHMSGFVYKVKVKGQVLIKKEIPGPDTVDEFLYEVNALDRLRISSNVIDFYGVVVDREEKVKGLLISYAEKGALVDIMYDHNHELEWELRRKWARQIVEGLSDIHESGFVQGDFTLSNIVIDSNNDAKIIDINRRGCPVGWEPPEATRLIESGQRISMHIGVKSDLFQLGMVLWALATEEDEPESHPRPLHLTALEAPRWYCRIVEICLNEDPRHRMQAGSLLSFFPGRNQDTLEYPRRRPASYSISGDDYSVQSSSNSQAYHYVDGVDASDATIAPRITTASPVADWVSPGYTELNTSVNALYHDNTYKPMRGRSPPKGGSPRGVIPPCSWQDNDNSKGWNSKSNTSRTGTSSQREYVHDREVGQSPDRLGVADAIQAVNESFVAPPVPVVPTLKNTSENTDAEQHADVEEPTAVSRPLVDAAAEKAAQIMMKDGTPHVANTQSPEHHAAVLPKGNNKAVEGVVENSTPESSTEMNGPGGTSSAQHVGLTELPVVSVMATVNADKNASRENYGTPEEQDVGNTVPDIKVETADSQGKDSGIDTSKTMNKMTELTAVCRAFTQRSTKDYESSNGQAIQDGIPSPRAPTSPSPTRNLAVRLMSASSDPMLLSGICGNTSPAMDQKRLRSELFKDLDAITNFDPLPDQEGRGTRCQESLVIENA